MHARNEATRFFWDLVEPLLTEPDISEGTLMGFPCLRVGGAFFATCDHRTGDLIVKLPPQRVAELVASGDGQPFAPAGRTFKEWVLVADRDPTQWDALLREARRFVARRSPLTTPRGVRPRTAPSQR